MVKRKLADGTHLTSALNDPTSATHQLLTTWADVPLLLMLDIDWERGPLVIVGLTDYMMSPLFPPGTLLQLDPKSRTIANGEWSEFERPVYLIEHRGKFYCCYAQHKGESLLLVSHSESPSRDITPIPFKEAKVRGQLKPVFRPLAKRGSVPGHLNKAHVSR
ncbi:MAG TPA: hypothetical protein VFH31_00965 [Pyrinomonadaceae bacterium]|nr:hypothetical protein [Pyrinomonadaceae bacterium]